jgi:hypothetical protein
VAAASSARQEMVDMIPRIVLALSLYVVVFG